MSLREIRRPPAAWQRYIFAICFTLCLIASILPVWVGRYLPAVDWPQHLFLISLMDELNSPDFAFRDLFVLAPGWTYLLFYFSIHFMAQILPLEAAFQVFLTLLLAAIPLSLLFLLKALKRSRWLSLLAFPMLFTYSFYWGLFSFMASIPWTFLSIAFFVRILEAPTTSGGEDDAFRWKSRGNILLFAGAAFSLSAVQLTHAAAMVFPAIALPLMLIMTPTDASRRKAACLSVIPGAALFAVWLAASMTSGHSPEKGTGPWQARGALFEAKTYVFHPLSKRLESIPSTLAGGFKDLADRPALYLWLAVIVLVIALAIKFRQDSAETSWRVRLRPASLFAAAFLCFLFLPTDVTGYMYMIHPRYCQMAALLLIPVIPFPYGKSFRIYAAAATALCLYSGINLAFCFHRFNQEAEEFDKIVQAIPPNSKIMHLVTFPMGSVASGAVYLHYAALAASRTHGIPSFSLARHDPFPVHYSSLGKATVPIPKWEWRPHQYNWKKEASWFDYYILHPHPGMAPQQVFGGDARRVELVAEQGSWSLWKKKNSPPERRTRQTNK